MTVGLLNDILDKIPRGVRLLGMDVGKKTIGLALSDPDHSVATPLKTIRRTKFTRDADELAKIVKDYEVGGFIVGLPLNMDGSEGRACQSVRDFAAELERYLIGDGVKFTPSPIWIALQDERLSTEAVEGLVDNFVDINLRQAKNRGITDQLAAMHILESALGLIRARL